MGLKIKFFIKRRLFWFLFELIDVIKVRKKMKSIILSDRQRIDHVNCRCAIVPVLHNHDSKKILSMHKDSVDVMTYALHSIERKLRCPHCNKYLFSNQNSIIVKCMFCNQDFHIENV